MYVIAVLILSLIMTTQIHGNCLTSCQDEAGCVDNLDPISRSIGINNGFICYQYNTCFNKSSSNSSKVPVQQHPLEILYGQNITFSISDFGFNNFTFRVFQSSRYTDFATCNLSIPLQYSIINNSLIELPPMKSGIHYLMFESNHILYTCQFGFRIQLTIYENECHFQNNKDPCSLKGLCKLNREYNKYQCHCCEPYYGKSCQEIDGCLLQTSPCSNNGECNDYVAGLIHPGLNCSCHEQFHGTTCDQCISGYTGANCSIDINECNQTSTICNYGQCNNTEGSFLCQCPVNVTGKLCDTDLYDNCLSSPCQGTNKTCIDKYGGFECQCPVDFTGKFCETKIDNCKDGSCDVEGTLNCVDGFGDYKCNCKSGYTGQHCEQNINDCIEVNTKNSSKCQNGGICIDLLNGFNCHCLPGYDGDQCQNIANKCQALEPCRNGTCVRIGTNKRDYVCNCFEGYEGQNCTEIVNKCRIFPCQNNSTCNFTFNDYTCDCLPGWEDKNCSSNIDACELLKPCENNATCVDSIHDFDYVCQCLTGFTGQNCSVNIDDCIGVNCINGQCIDGINSSYCQCDDGWFGEKCNVDKDYCGLSPCVNEIECINVPNTPGFKCICKSGYTGQSCVENIDDCINNTCQNNAVCRDLINDYNCTCAPGYQGQFCEIDINECDNDPCLNNATCQNLVNQYFCACKPGFEGKNCEININECISDPCQHNSTCIDKVNDFECNCTEAYSGKDCGIHICSLNDTCLNGGQCEDTGTGFKCHCPQEFTGKYCNISVNECENSTICLHNGVCVDLYKGYQCRCVFPFNGTNCETHECDTDICQNNGSCIKSNTNFTCDCVYPWTGRHCQDLIDVCIDKKPCLNNGSCISGPDSLSYTCNCTFPYNGTGCQYHVCDIAFPCHNGTCMKTHGGFQCQCNPGFTSQDCSTDINECLVDDVCQNNGACVNMVGNFSCVCGEEYTGRLCEKKIEYCNSTTCLNGGVCINDYVNHKFKCICNGDYTGSQCDAKVSICINQTCNHGDCFDHNNGSFSCHCNFGFFGANCQQFECPCFEDGGRCVRENASEPYQCLCKAGFTGKLCDTFTTDCRNTSKSCVLDSYCQQADYGYVCVCPPHLQGERCNKPGLCSYEPCKNNGTCLSLETGGYQCLCNEEYTGNQCQYDLNECLSSPCQHNGRCAEDGIGSFKCYCLEGYNGTQCEKRLNPNNSATSLLVIGSSSNELIMTPTIETTKHMQTSVPILQTYTSQDIQLATTTTTTHNTTELTPAQLTTSLQQTPVMTPTATLPNVRSTLEILQEKTSILQFSIETLLEQSTNKIESAPSSVSIFPGNISSKLEILSSSKLHKLSSSTSKITYPKTTSKSSDILSTSDIDYSSSTKLPTAILSPDHILPTLSVSLSLKPTYIMNTNSKALQSTKTLESISYAPMQRNSYSSPMTLTSTDQLLVQSSFEINPLSSTSFIPEISDLVESSKLKVQSSAEMKSSTSFIPPETSDITESSKLNSPPTNTNIQSSTIQTLTSVISPELSEPSLVSQTIHQTVSLKFTTDLSTPTNTDGQTQTIKQTSNIRPQSSSRDALTTTFQTETTAQPTHTETTQSFVTQTLSIAVPQNSIQLQSSPQDKIQPFTSLGSLPTQLLTYSSRVSELASSTSYKYDLTQTRLPSDYLPIESTNQLVSSSPEFHQTYMVTTTESPTNSHLRPSSSVDNHITKIMSTPITNTDVLPSIETPFSPNTDLYTSLLSSSISTSKETSSMENGVFESTFFYKESSNILESSLEMKSSALPIDPTDSLHLSMTSIVQETIPSWSTGGSLATSFLEETSILPTKSIPIDFPSSSVVVPTRRPHINLTCDDQPCNGYPCSNVSDNGLMFRCQCPFPTVSPRCSIASVIHFPRFNGHSYLELPPITMTTKQNTIHIIFHTINKEGLLLYAFHQNFKDHLEIFIQNGKLAVSLSTGDTAAMVTTHQRIDNGQTIASSIKIDAAARLVTISIENGETVSKAISSSLKSVQLTSSWFLGGTPDDVYTESGITKFNGCVKEFTVNSKPYRLAERIWFRKFEVDIGKLSGSVFQNIPIQTEPLKIIRSGHKV
ncbi:protein eyes shut homolog [Clytia hemisphaerica]|uniref:protein eyes shut homolog n=1 Tax=Clytia hemisphaerica TaxID=252671 RepID=UPI0034D54201